MDNNLLNVSNQVKNILLNQEISEKKMIDQIEELQNEFKKQSIEISNNLEYFKIQNNYKMAELENQNKKLQDELQKQSCYFNSKIAELENHNNSLQDELLGQKDYLLKMTNKYEYEIEILKNEIKKNIKN